MQKADLSAEQGYPHIPQRPADVLELGVREDGKDCPPSNRRWLRNGLVAVSHKIGTRNSLAVAPVLISACSRSSHRAL